MTEGDVDRVRAARAALSAVPPGEFVSERKRLVVAARAEGDREAATAIAALRKPSEASWAVNLLARKRPELTTAVLDLGAELRQAQDRLDGVRLRELAPRRREVVRAARTGATDLAATVGRPVSDAVADRVEALLTAALTDQALAAALRLAEVDENAAPAGDDLGGFALGGEVPAGAGRAVGGGPVATKPPSATEETTRAPVTEPAREDRERLLRQARDHCAAAARDVRAALLRAQAATGAGERAEAGHAEALQTREAAAAEVERLRHALQGAQAAERDAAARVAAAAEARTRARREVPRAESELAAAERELASAEQRLAALGQPD